MDLTQNLFSRLIILLLVALALTAIEAAKRNQADTDKNVADINHLITKTDAEINSKNKSLGKLNAKKNSLGSQIAKKTSDIDEIVDELKKNKKKKLHKKLGPIKYADRLFDLTRLQLERVPLLTEYTKTMFSIVDGTKEIAIKNTKRAHLEYQRTVAKQSNTLDYLVKYKTRLLNTHHLVVLALLFYGLFFGRLTLKAINYYLFAPLARKSQPVLINDAKIEPEYMIRYGAPQKEITLQVDNKHSLVVKPGWYTLSTDGITRTRFFWDSANPFASYAMGLVNMTEFENYHDQVREIKIASEVDPNHEILAVHLKDHPGYIVRHDHVVATSGKGLAMKKKWQFWDWRSWLYGNVRYVYFTGTGTIYVHGYGSVSTNDTTANSRIKERHVIGFDTTTPFKLLRADTFINYWLNNKPLYDIHFPKQGRFLQQQSMGNKEDKIFRSLLEDILGAIGKVLGL